MAAALAAQMLAQQHAGARIEQTHEHRVPLHMDLPPDPARRCSIVSRFDFDAAIEMNRALAILVVAERFQRQRLQGEASLRRTSPLPAAWFGHGCACRPSVLPSDPDMPAPLPGSRTSCPSAASSAHGRRRLRLFLFDLDPALCKAAPSRRSAPERRDTTDSSADRRCRRQHALAKVIQDHDPRRTAKPAKCLLVKLGPYPCTRTEDQQSNRLATPAQRQNKQPRAPVLAAVGIAHHRPRAVVNLRLFTGLVSMIARASGDTAPRKLRTNRLTLW